MTKVTGSCILWVASESGILNLEVIVMAHLSRRDFIRMLAAGTGALTMQQLLAACGIETSSLLPPTSTLATPTQPPQAAINSPSPAATTGEVGSTSATPEAAS